MIIDILEKDPRLQDISKEKLIFLEKLFFESKTKSQKELLPFLLSLTKKAKEEKIEFTDDETSRIIEVIREHSTPTESQKIAMILEKMSHKT